MTGGRDGEKEEKREGGGVMEGMRREGNKWGVSTDFKTYYYAFS